LNCVKSTSSITVVKRIWDECQSVLPWVGRRGAAVMSTQGLCWRFHRDLSVFWGNNGGVVVNLKHELEWVEKP
jgi:hypothetical protein